ncbi:DUF3575 domain-containing protein [uncultured Porphyromonas sp.]|uniref:DUF3575 domain-containing protein n=1 Tax=uncultured Porphyromonas sp. TaxID=159274 RepID=UPI00262EC2F0|nr:DUF3575 domain-containing protein [uncultured Porphyromonas sp.]
MKRIFLKTLLLLTLSLGAGRVMAQEIGVKTNALYLGTSTLNAGLDFKLANQWSGSLHMGYNPWQFSGAQATWANGEVVDANRKAIHFLAMPEVKWWPCQVFVRHAIGLHGIFANYNASGWPFPKKLQDRRYTGELYGVGLSWGYQWAIGQRSGIELSLGAGYLWTNYTCYEAGACGQELYKGHKGFFAPTKAAINFIYYLK